MIQLSIERVNSDLIVSENLQNSIPIYFIEEIKKLKKLVPAKDYKYLKAINFQGFYGDKVILSKPDGSIGKVIIGCNSLESSNPTFFIGSQISKLPEGIYSIKNLPENLNVIELYLGFYFSFYSFSQYRKFKFNTPKITNKKLCESSLTDHSRFFYLAESEYIARDLINSPANFLGPSELQDYAKSFSEYHKTSFSSILGTQLKKENLPLIHEVGRASVKEPRLIEIRYGRNDSPFSITIVGKGVCFDSGGLNLKSSVGMINMKKDMAGAAVVLGLGHYLIRQELDLNLRILIPCVENSISNNAYRQGDVLKSRSGKFVEVKNTDAEGRLILADTLTLAVEENPDLLVSFATLTGSARVAMGTDLTPFFSSSYYVANLVKSGGEEFFDPVWQLPFYEDYQEQLGSEIADLNNAPSGSMAG